MQVFPSAAVAAGCGEAERDHRQAELQPSGSPGQQRPGTARGPVTCRTDPGLTEAASAGTTLGNIQKQVYFNNFCNHFLSFFRCYNKDEIKRCIIMVTSGAWSLPTSVKIDVDVELVLNIIFLLYCRLAWSFCALKVKQWCPSHLIPSISSLLTAVAP